MQVDLLFVTAHPDDVELCGAGTLLHHIALGAKVGIVDLTGGELGTRGNAEIRAQEAAEAARILGVSFREILDLPDGFFELSAQHKLPVIEAIRRYKPKVVITNAESDRHPDHGRAAKLVADACFLAGLPKIELTHNGVQLEAWRPKQVYHMIQDHYLSPDVCVDITPYMQKKTEAILAFKSQFFDPTSPEPSTPISGQDFLDFLNARAREMGRLIGVEFAEGFTKAGPVRKNNLLN